MAVTLLSDTDAMVPGRPFLVGVRFQIREGWHIYASDPGDAGLPTRVRMSVPADFGQGSVLYPEPEHFESPGGIVTQGYEREAVLAIPITPPAVLEPETRTTLEVEASWLACRDICVKESGNASLTLPVSSPVHPAFRINEVLFEPFQSRTAQRSEGDSR